MSYFTDSQNDFAIYDAPKTGGTTLRLWICYAGTGELMTENPFPGTEYFKDNRKSYDQLCEWGYDLLGGFSKSAASTNVCIKRDPVKRFISCYRDKVLLEGRCSVSVDDLLDHYDEVVRQHNKPHHYMWDQKTSYIKFHFDPQTSHFGNSVDYFDNVFDISEIGTGVKQFLESKWKIELPDIHARSTKGVVPELNLSVEQIDKIKKFYQVDYENGWF